MPKNVFIRAYRQIRRAATCIQQTNKWLRFMPIEMLIKDYLRFPCIHAMASHWYAHPSEEMKLLTYEINFRKYDKFQLFQQNCQNAYSIRCVISSLAIRWNWYIARTRMRTGITVRAHACNNESSEFHAKQLIKIYCTRTHTHIRIAHLYFAKR